MTDSCLSPLRWSYQIMAWLSRTFRAPKAILQVYNHSMGWWQWQLAPVGSFRVQAGVLDFFLVERATGRRIFAGRLSRPGQALRLKPGGSYQIELRVAQGPFLRFFQLLDGRGEGIGRCLVLAGELPQVRIRPFEGAPLTLGSPLQVPAPDLLIIERNCW